MRQFRHIRHSLYGARLFGPPREKRMQGSTISGSILIVDDQQIVRQVMRTALQERGYELIVAADGNEALEFCRATDSPMHLAIVDIMMPGLGTASLLAGLRNRFPDIRVLLTSGYPRHEAFERAGLVETDCHFLAKPFTVSEFRSRVREELAAQRYCASEHADFPCAPSFGPVAHAAHRIDELALPPQLSSKSNHCDHCG